MPHRQRTPQYFEGRPYDLWFETQEQAKELILKCFGVAISGPGDLYMSHTFKSVALSHGIVQKILGSKHYMSETRMPIVLRPFHFKDRGS